MKFVTDNHWLYFDYKNKVEQTMFNFTHDLFYSNLIESYKWDSVIDMQTVCYNRINGSILIKPSGCGTWFIYDTNPTQWIVKQIEYGNIVPKGNITELIIFRIEVVNPTVESDFDVRIVPTLLAFNPESQDFQPVTELEYFSAAFGKVVYTKQISTVETKEGK